jgi:ribosomal subunit interface protein
MEIPLQITFRDVPASSAVEAKIRENAQRLDRHFDRITACRVVVTAITRRHLKGRLYHIRIDLTVPGSEIAISRESGHNHAHEDIYVAVRDAFKAARRRLEDHARRRSDHRVKAHPPTHHGRVARIFADDGYGFIAAPGRGDVYFHRNAVIDGGWEKLDTGSDVRFTEAEGKDGPHATSVTPLDRGAVRD